MPRALALVDQDDSSLSVSRLTGDSARGLAARYIAILKQYKMVGWGVCDESYDKQRAVELCDAYYGFSNTLVRKVQDQGKPVMIAAGK